MITKEEAQKLLDSTTPGPWAVDYAPSQSPHIWVGPVCAPNIAKLEIWDRDDGKGERLDKQDFADATLISDAPDLARTVIALYDELDRVRADARLAVADALRKAGEVCQDLAQGPASSPDALAFRGDAFIDAKVSILALADQDALAEVEALRAERDSFRAVLEGAQYGDIDGIGQNTPEQSRHLGEEVMHRTIKCISEREAAKARAAKLEAERDALVEAGDALDIACAKAIGIRKHPAWEAIRNWRNITATKGDVT